MGCHNSKSTETGATKPKLGHSKSSLEESAPTTVPNFEKTLQDTDAVTVSTADNTDDAPCVVLSEYNDDNYCTVIRVLRSGPGRVALDFVAVGNGSLGCRLPDPMNSVLAWPGGSVKPTSHVYEREDCQYISGTLHYTLDEDYFIFYYLSGELTFSYGTEGFSAAAIIVQGAGTEAGAQAWMQLHQVSSANPVCGQLTRVSEGGDSPSESQTPEDLKVDRGVLLLPCEDPHVPAANTPVIPGVALPADSGPDGSNQHLDQHIHPYASNGLGDVNEGPLLCVADKQPDVGEVPSSIIVRAGPEAEIPVCCRGLCCPHGAGTTSSAKASM